MLGRSNGNTLPSIKHPSFCLDNSACEGQKRADRVPSMFLCGSKRVFLCHSPHRELFLGLHVDMLRCLVGVPTVRPCMYALPVLISVAVL